MPEHDLWRRENLAKKMPPPKAHVPSVLDRPVVKLLRRLGWEPDLWTRKGIETWRRPHPNDIEEYPTRRALWLALTRPVAPRRLEREGMASRWVGTANTSVTRLDATTAASTAMVAAATWRNARSASRSRTSVPPRAL